MRPVQLHNLLSHLTCFVFYIVASREFVLVDLSTASISELQHSLESGAFTSVDLVRTYIVRIQELNPLIHAVSEVNPDALSIAARLDHERALGRSCGHLHGIPILLKDNIATTDALNTTTGSYALLGARPSREASIVTKLRDAGAIILGKATMGEWAQFRSWGNTSSHGWSAYGGQPLGVFHERQDPHGSSSGCGGAVAAGLAAACIGTETSGSIVNPSEKGNLVGIKPTLGLTSRDGVIPISTRQDSVGPMARTVRDAAVLLDVMAGRDRRDNWTMAQPEIIPDFAKAANRMSLLGARVGIPRNGIAPFLNDDTTPIMKAFEQALRIIHGADAAVTDHADFPHFNMTELGHNQEIILGTDFSHDIPEYLSSLNYNPNNIHTLTDILNFTIHDPREDYVTRSTQAWDSALLRHFHSSSIESFTAYQRNAELATTFGIDAVLDNYDLDALVMPTFTSFHLPAAGGLPIVTVPLGFFPAHTPVRKNPIGTMIQIGPGIPFGIAFVGRKWSDAKLIELAAAFEELTVVRERGKSVVIASANLEDRIASTKEISMDDVVVTKTVDPLSHLNDDLAMSNRSSWSVLEFAGSLFGVQSLTTVR